MRTILAADLDLRPDTAAKIATMEAIIAPVREAIENEDWTVVESAMTAMGFESLDLYGDDNPFEDRLTNFLLEEMVVMFDDPETKLWLNVCEHVHTLEEFRELFCGDPLTEEHFKDGYQVVRREDGRQFVVYRTYKDDYYDCGEVSA